MSTPVFLQLFLFFPGPWHPLFSLLSSSSSSLHFFKRSFHEITCHSYFWSTLWFFPLHSSLQHITQQSISPKHLPYPVLFPFPYCSYLFMFLSFHSPFATPLQW